MDLFSRDFQIAARSEPPWILSAEISTLVEFAHTRRRAHVAGAFPNDSHSSPTHKGFMVGLRRSPEGRP